MMPYINQSDRGVYKTSLMAVLDAVRRGKDQVQQVEMVAWWCHYVIRRFAGTTAGNLVLNANNFDEDVRRILKHQGDIVVSLLQNKYRENNIEALLSVAGHINYCLSSVCWGFLGDALNFSSGRYGMRCLLAEMLRSMSYGISSDSDTWSRKHTMLRGVINDVLDEMYRRKTAFYEDEKITQNGDVWQDGQLI